MTPEEEIARLNEEEAFRDYLRGILGDHATEEEVGDLGDAFDHGVAWGRAHPKETPPPPPSPLFWKSASPAVEHAGKARTLIASAAGFVGVHNAALILLEISAQLAVKAATETSGRFSVEVQRNLPPGLSSLPLSGRLAYLAAEAKRAPEGAVLISSGLLAAWAEELGAPPATAGQEEEGAKA